MITPAIHKRIVTVHDQILSLIEVLQDVSHTLQDQEVESIKPKLERMVGAQGRKIERDKLKENIKEAYRPLPQVRFTLGTKVAVDGVVGQLADLDQQVDLRSVSEKLARRPNHSLQELVEEHRKLAAKTTLASDPATRSEQALPLIRNLSVLLERLDAIEAQAWKEAKANHRSKPVNLPQIDSLRERITGEQDLIYSVISSHKSVKRQVPLSMENAIELRRLGIDCDEDVLHEGANLDPGSLKKLGNGAVNTVYLVKDTEGIEWVYKPGLARTSEVVAAVDEADKRGGDIMDRQHSNGHKASVAIDLRQEARNVAASRVDEVLGMNVIVGTTITYMGKQPFVENIMASPHPPDRSDLDDQISDFGILMKKVDGKLGSELVGTPVFDKVLSNPAFKRDISNLALVDALLGSLDRHDSNFMIEVDGDEYKGVKGIDNDFCLFNADFDLERQRSFLREEGDALRSMDMKPEDYVRYKDARNAVIGMASRLDNALQSIQDDELRAYVSKQFAKYDATVAYVKIDDEHFYNGTPEMLVALKDVRANLVAKLDKDHFIMQTLDLAVQWMTQMIEANYNRLVAMKNLEQDDVVYSVSAKAAVVHALGLPTVVDQEMADKVMDPEFEDAILQGLSPLLTAEEQAATLQRISIIKHHIQNLQAEGRVVKDWGTHPNLDTLLADTKHSHWGRMKQKHENPDRVP